MVDWPEAVLFLFLDGLFAGGVVSFSTCCCSWLVVGSWLETSGCSSLGCSSTTASTCTIWSTSGVGCRGGVSRWLNMTLYATGTRASSGVTFSQVNFPARGISFAKSKFQRSVCLRWRMSSSRASFFFVSEWSTGPNNDLHTLLDGTISWYPNMIAIDDIPLLALLSRWVVSLDWGQLRRTRVFKLRNGWRFSANQREVRPVSIKSPGTREKVRRAQRHLPEQENLQCASVYVYVCMVWFLVGPFGPGWWISNFCMLHKKYIFLSVDVSVVNFLLQSAKLFMITQFVTCVFEKLYFWKQEQCLSNMIICYERKAALLVHVPTCLGQVTKCLVISPTHAAWISISRRFWREKFRIPQLQVEQRKCHFLCQSFSTSLQLLSLDLSVQSLDQPHSKTSFHFQF